MIDDLIEDLKRDEGWRPFAYDDATGEPIHRGVTLEGYVTVGYGFCLDSERGAPIPHDVADLWITRSIEERWHRLIDELPWLVDQPERIQRALGNMAYQLGIAGVQAFSRMLAALQASEYETAADEALDSRWARQTPVRARRIASLIRGD